MGALTVVLAIAALVAVGLGINYAITHDERGGEENDDDRD